MTDNNLQLIIAPTVSNDCFIGNSQLIFTHSNNNCGNLSFKPLNDITSMLSFNGGNSSGIIELRSNTIGDSGIIIYTPYLFDEYVIKYCEINRELFIEFFPYNTGNDIINMHISDVTHESFTIKYNSIKPCTFKIGFVIDICGNKYNIKF